MSPEKHDFNSVLDELNNAKLAVERAQEDQAGFTEAQQHVKHAEEVLNSAKHDPSFTDEKAMQRATDLLRLIEETNQALKK
ncbi:hypothetical protein [Thalassobacillus pellis]|uniref:hypothetical protein n=1 Tax=Thalassobacillus pellis TaxID=748008 RepID=UPI0019610E30|nr:hypothetical protein [Thalassobacillus pellis]MBM7554213.1 hypothetical protein [Thalassobacillus pellis]